MSTYIFFSANLASLYHTQEDIIILSWLAPHFACFIWSFAKEPLLNVENIIGFSFKGCGEGVEYYFLNFLAKMVDFLRKP